MRSVVKTSVDTTTSPPDPQSGCGARAARPGRETRNRTPLSHQSLAVGALTSARQPLLKPKTNSRRPKIMKTMATPEPRVNRSAPALFGGLAALFALAACSSGGGSNTESTTPGTSGDFVVLRTEPANNGQLFLNESISVDFSNPVDLSTADLNTVSFQVFDLNGNPLTEQPQGSFSVRNTPGDTVANRRLVFSPRFPTNDTFDNGGFRPGRRYLVQLAAGQQNTTTLQDALTNQRLRRPSAFEFRTADGTTPFELFRDTRAGGPRRTGFTVSQLSSGVAPLSLLGQAGVEVRLDFDQPLNPSSANVPVGISPDPTRRTGRGRIYMEYDNANTNQTNIWIPATVEFARNSLEGSTVVLRPIGVFPNNAQIRVIVAKTVEDMAGESNISDTAYNPVFATFNTRTALEPQYDALVERFDGSSKLDLSAPLLEPLAELRAGRLQSTFNFDGSQSTLDYEPSSRETLLNTNFTQIAPVGSEPINVSGGVFRFRNVNIPANRLVRGVGPNPMVWLVTGNFRVDGTLSVSGGDGGRVDTLNSANFPTGGGIGVCGGGNGGKGSPNATDRSTAGEQGFGPGQRPNQGGFPGSYYCGGGSAACTGEPGGGGSYSTQGDPEFNDRDTTWNQWRGFGGTRCATVNGAAPGPRPFVDSRDDNDFWGATVNVAAGLRITGELIAPLGGSGGGGGGDKTPTCTPNVPSTFINDEKGGGGGAGGGVLIIQSLGRIFVGPQGRIAADGGLGGGGEQAGSNNKGGGGGAGSGGMIVLMAAGGVEIERHGGPYYDQYPATTSDDRFAISADGNVCEQGEFGNAQILDKYLGFVGSRNVNHATGGFGGMGIVQILTPPGSDPENSGSFLDDEIDIVSSGGAVSVLDKQRLLGWRGWDDGTGQRRDDRGNPIVVDGDGDIRPAPILMPLTYGSKSRAQSVWIDLGTVARTPGTSGAGVVNVATAPTPDYEFAGTRDSSTAADTQNYITWDSNTGARTVPVVVPGSTFSDPRTDETFGGANAYRVRVNSALLAGVPDNRYAHYRAELLDSFGSVASDHRILGHTRVTGTNDNLIYLETDSPLSTSATEIRIVAKFFEVTTNGEVGLGAFNTAFAPEPRPRSNVRVGFAFHVDPTNTTTPNLRYPASGFSSDVSALLQQMRNDGQRPTYVKWDVLFNQDFDLRFGGANPITPDLPTQTLEYLVLPFRF